MSAAWPPAFLPSLQDPDVKPAATGSAELPRSVLKHLKPLGHEIKLWSSATAQLVGRLRKDRLPTELSAFLRAWMPDSVPEMPDGAFTLLLGETTQGWQIATSSLPWVNDPIWIALLRLPALRHAWMNDLRASHFDHLLHLLPQAWIMDATPLPPGAVIPGLEIPSWPHLAQHRGHGRHFQLTHPGHTNPEQTLNDNQPLTEWQNALAQGERVITERPPVASWILARYHQNEGDLSLAEAWISTANQVQSVL